MASAHLTRRVTFTAEHRYHRPDWSAGENARVFGHAEAPYHAHIYSCAVTIGGPVDPDSGMLVDLRALDAILAREVVDRFDQRKINDDVPEFADGKMTPTGENLARFIFDRVSARLSGPAKVTEVIVAEDATLSASYRRD